jgi:methyl-accepting chemotaxis protein
MQTALTSLSANDESLKNLTGLLQSTGRTLQESIEFRNSANHAAGQMAEAQADTSATLRNMAGDIIPKVNAIAAIRIALLDANSAERAILLALNMSHLGMDELEAARDSQLRTFDASRAAIDKAREEYQSRISAYEERRAWDFFVLALDAWWENHLAFMDGIKQLDNLVMDNVRAGPLFSSATRKAYDTVFVTGKAARETCEQRIEALYSALNREADGNVGRALGSLDASAALLADMGREASMSAERATGLSLQFDEALAAADQATMIAAGALNDTVNRSGALAALAVVVIFGTISVGVFLAVRFSRPVRGIALHMAKLARGNVADDVPEADRNRTDEIGILARAMQELVHSNRTEIAMANAMANGDYTKSISLRSDDDQLGVAFRTMLSTSNATLSQVGRSMEQMTDDAQSVSEASLSLSQGAQTSAQALEEINESVGRVDVQAKENAARAAEANRLAMNSRDAARRGYAAVIELVDAMKEIQQAGAKIAIVAKLIDDIAFQTNLLALNAAVEAARAGRPGKGFSVVADEVRNLSGRSAKAARETSEMVEAMNDRMRAGSELAVRSDNEFRDIVEATNQVAYIFQEISAASDAQSVAMAQIAGGLGQIDGVIQKNTQSASSTESSAINLSRQAEELNRMVSRFRLVSGAGGAQAVQERSGAARAPEPALPAGLSRLMLPDTSRR